MHPCVSFSLPLSPTRSSRVPVRAGGILLGAAFCHLLPDLVHAGLAVGIAATPTPYLFVMLGLLLPYVLEQSPLVQWCLQGTGGAPAPAASNTSATAVELASLTGAAVPEEIDDDALPSVDTASAPRASGSRVVGGSGGGGGLENGAAASAPVALVAGAVARSAPAPAAHLDLGHSHAGVELTTGPRSGLSLAFLLVLTLAVHSLLEGIGIGVQDEVACVVRADERGTEGGRGEGRRRHHEQQLRCPLSLAARHRLPRTGPRSGSCWRFSATRGSRRSPSE